MLDTLSNMKMQTRLDKIAWSNQSVHLCRIEISGNFLAAKVPLFIRSSRTEMTQAQKADNTMRNKMITDGHKLFGANYGITDTDSLPTVIF